MKSILSILMCMTRAYLHGKCWKHGGGRKCSVADCTKNPAARGISKAHGAKKKCKEASCSSPSLRKGLCMLHGGGKRCSEDRCDNLAQAGPHCVKHGGSKRCERPGCSKLAQRGAFCVRHGGGERCPGCVDWPDSRVGDKKYDGYCATCFKRVFPEDPRSSVIYQNTEEIQVRNAINARFEGFVHNQTLHLGCDWDHRRRVDHRRLVQGTFLCIETDEFGHRCYCKKGEEIRYDDLFMVFGGKWIFIRFNPDGAGVTLDEKISVLLDTIQQQMDRIRREENKELLEIIKLFY